MHGQQNIKQGWSFRFVVYIYIVRTLYAFILEVLCVLDAQYKELIF
jgi:hypothetical protein